MNRVANKYGGGSNANKNGERYEILISLDTELKKAGYKVKNYHVIKNNKEIGLSVPKYKFYSEFLKPNGINYKDIISKRWVPDDAFVNFKTSTVYIIEKKYQSQNGSVDEKLPNCEFKRLEYVKLVEDLGYEVKFIYILNEKWFSQKRYEDTLKYIDSKINCKWYFDFKINYIDL